MAKVEREFGVCNVASSGKVRFNLAEMAAHYTDMFDTAQRVLPPSPAGSTPSPTPVLISDAEKCPYMLHSQETMYNFDLTSEWKDMFTTHFAARQIFRQILQSSMQSIASDRSLLDAQFDEAWTDLMDVIDADAVDSLATDFNILDDPVWTTQFEELASSLSATPNENGHGQTMTIEMMQKRYESDQMELENLRKLRADDQHKMQEMGQILTEFKRKVDRISKAREDERRQINRLEDRLENERRISDIFRRRLVDANARLACGKRGRLDSVIYVDISDESASD